MQRSNLRQASHLGRGFFALTGGSIFLIIVAQLLLLAWSTQAQAQAAPTTVAFVAVSASDSFASERTFAGRTVAARSSEIGFRRPGQIERVTADIGDVVTAGTLLAQLDDAALAAAERQAIAAVGVARANIAALEAEVQLARNTQGRFAKLLQSRHVSKQEFDEADLNLKAAAARLNVARANHSQAVAALDAARVARAETHLLAPYDGVIQRRYADEGAQLNANQPLLRLVERGVTELHVGVPTTFGDQLDVDREYNFRWQNDRFVARLRSLLPEVDVTSRTVTAVFTLTDATIPIGSVVELTHAVAVSEPGFWVPIGSLTSADRGLWSVYVIGADTRIERRLVDIVHREAERVFVRGTLADGDRVVAAGAQRIVPGQRVQPVAMLQAHAG